jgi:hypothetical protein
MLYRALQMRGEVAKERGGVSTALPGSWYDICIVLTHQRLPTEYRTADRSNASKFLQGLLGVSALYNALGVYMLQVEAIHWQFVKDVDYEGSRDPLKQLSDAHLTCPHSFFRWSAGSPGCTPARISWTCTWHS